MRKRTAVPTVIVAVSILVAAGLGVAHSASSASQSSPAPASGVVPASRVPQPSPGKLIPGARTSPLPPVADTTSGEDQRLREDDYSIETTPSDKASAISRDQAIDIAKSIAPGYANQGKAATARHVVFTAKDQAALSDAFLASMGVKERPLNLDAWMVTFHKVTLRRHGPPQSNAGSRTGNFVVVISASTGDFVMAVGYGPVQ